MNIKKWFWICMINCFCVSSVLAQQGFWSTEMKKIATARSTYGWIYIRPELRISAMDLMANYAQEFGFKEQSEWVLKDTKTDELGIRHFHFTQRLFGLPVVGTEVRVHERNDLAFLVNGQAAVWKPTALASRTSELLLQDLNKVLSYTPEFISAGEEVYLAVREDDRSLTAKRAIRFEVKKDFVRTADYYLDIYTGKLLLKEDLHKECSTGSAVTAKYGTKTVYTKWAGSYYIAHNDCGAEQLLVKDQLNDTLPSSIFDWIDTDNSWTSAWSPGMQTLYCLQQTSGYFNSVHGRASFTGAPRTTVALANCRFRDSSSWTGWGAFYYNDTMYFGANGVGVADDLGVLDIVAHEYTHGVTEYTSGLIYYKETGAINESFSDIFGEIVEHYTQGSNNWITGTDCGSNLRNFINPLSYGHPDSYYGQFWHSVTGTTQQDSADNFGVHTNSSVQNHMFYLLVAGGTDTNALGDVITIPGIGMNSGRSLAYYTLDNFVIASTDYYDARKAWLAASDLLFGYCSYEHQQLAQAWDMVGVLDNVTGAIGPCGVYPYSNGSGLVTAVNAQYFIQAGSSCSNTISTSAPVSYSASQFIQLFPGFHAVPGSNFSARIDECNLGLYKLNNAMSTELLVEDDPNATNVSTAVASLDIFPNPVRSDVRFEFRLEDDMTKGYLRINDAVGKLVFEQDLTPQINGQGTFRMDISGWPPGAYSVELYGDDMLKLGKNFIKM